MCNNHKLDHQNQHCNQRCQVQHKVGMTSIHKAYEHQAVDKADHHMLSADRHQLLYKVVLTVLGTSSRPWLLSSLLKFGSGVLDLLLLLLLL